MLGLRHRATRPDGIDLACKTVLQSKDVSRDAHKVTSHRNVGKNGTTRPASNGWGGGKSYPARQQKQWAPDTRFTKMPLKTSKSDVLLLLNKLGGDNVDQIADQLYEICAKAEQKEELIAWLQNKTIEQPTLADVYAEMWVRVFRRDRRIRELYLGGCNARFRSIQYDSSDNSECILEICHAMTAAYKVRIIDQRPLLEIIGALIANILNVSHHRCCHGLSVILGGTKGTLVQAVNDNIRRMNETDQHAILSLMFTTASPSEHCATVHPIVCRPIVQRMDRVHLDDLVNNVFIEHHPKPPQVTLLMNIVSDMRMIRRLVRLLIEMVSSHPELVESILVIFKWHGSNLPLKTIADMDLQATNYVSTPGCSMKLKFKFMDYMDLKKTNWKSRK